MASKKEGGIGESVKDVIGDIVSGMILNQFKDAAKEFLKDAQKVAYHTEKKILESLLATTILIIGIIFIVVSIPFIISKYLNLENYWGFLIMGFVLVVISLILYSRIKKTKYYKVK